MFKMYSCVPDLFSVKIHQVRIPYFFRPLCCQYFSFRNINMNCTNLFKFFTEFTRKKNPVVHVVYEYFVGIHKCKTEVFCADNKMCFRTIKEKQKKNEHRVSEGVESCSTVRRPQGSNMQQYVRIIYLFTCLFTYSMEQSPSWKAKYCRLEILLSPHFCINTLRTGLLNCLNARSRGLTFRHRASCI